MPVLQGKVAIVTGVSSGIGGAAAKLFAREGAQVIVTTRRQPEFAALVDEIQDSGGEAVAEVGDVRDEALAIGLVETARRRFGGLDIAFNNAGVLGEMVALETLTADDWRETLEVDLTAAFLTAKHQAPAMADRGGHWPA